MTEALTSDKTQSFYSPIKKSGLKTFADMNKKTKFKSGDGGIKAGAQNEDLQILDNKRLVACAVRFGIFTSRNIRLAILRLFKCKMASCLKLLNC